MKRSALAQSIISWLVATCSVHRVCDSHTRCDEFATEADVLQAEARYHSLFELVDGVLVEKGMGYTESVITLALAAILRAFIIPRNLGVLSGADGMIRLFPGLLRAPDLAFAGWDRIPDGRLPKEPIPTLVPDLAIEILSQSNTDREMGRKRGEYFDSGVRLIWEADLELRVVTVFTREGNVTILDATRTLDGGEVLPGFTLPLDGLFSKLDQRG